MPSSVYHIEDNQYLLKEKNEHTTYFSEQQILLSHHLEVSWLNLFIQTLQGKHLKR